ncbi:FG-GAP-like repeat-containing protein [Psychroserpens sp.]|uniref:FG-GAP-like repeat-containing protein n=1 Tax=Psychroserpens sp. TaxID=2020870 RepID=UPI001AFFA1E8|nr:FG-GAP-like repeat-containing protein [Psychroserpens sp.]MBO6606795.1 VCBS repeat-containing protein [Psychroserpens sp.]MBO6653498.1 VCBS repeat-containing protein [Psychroserpens sp.]MBO6680474.1 VCBS repeat-containing protein [Psychroserpens sp.]MBO6750567.1 VCBS repeat-containing protein [Psychroserpens sp.]MBO6915050.1 VCBS repeat-containing protein [Psychroserpens sp.]
MKIKITLILFALIFFKGFSQIQFEDQANALGIPVTAGDTYLGNGISFFDFDNDGWDDITFATDLNDGIRIFKNVNGTFVEQNYQLQYLTYDTKSVTWVDFDNDGDNDLFVTSETVNNKLLENQGNMTFVDITDTTGLSLANLYTYGASWGDYNNDGYLDVFLSNRTFFIPNKLYKNNGDGTFQDVTLFAGIDLTPLYSFCSAFLDINNDGYQDLYVSNDKVNMPNKLYKNNGNGTFTDISVSSGTNISIDAMSVTVDDYNNDGYVDIYVTNTQGGNELLRNNGDETFTNVAGPTLTTFNSIGWGALFIDADNNKELDLYVSGSLEDTNAGGYLSAAFYENNGNGSFSLSNSCFPNDNRSSYSNAMGDINNDGLMDIAVTNGLGKNIFLWKNVSTTTNNWLKLKLTGTTSNKNAIGSWIEIGINGEKQYRYTHLGEGYMSQNSGVEHFGVGDATLIDYVKITWLSGLVEIFNDVPVNQLFSITEGNNTLDVIKVEKDDAIIFPNPAEDVVNIVTNNPLESLEIINALGQVVFVSNKNLSSQIDISFLAQGHYILKVKTKTGITNHRLIKH